jgi:hypothetical protein
VLLKLDVENKQRTDSHLVDRILNRVLNSVLPDRDKEADLDSLAVM